eukprot:240055-Prorocentrum_minimum.AAC.1
MVLAPHLLLFVHCNALELLGLASLHVHFPLLHLHLGEAGVGESGQGSLVWSGEDAKGGP